MRMRTRTRTRTRMSDKSIHDLRAGETSNHNIVTRQSIMKARHNANVPSHVGSWIETIRIKLREGAPVEIPSMACKVPMIYYSLELCQVFGPGVPHQVSSSSTRFGVRKRAVIVSVYSQDSLHLCHTLRELSHTPPRAIDLQSPFSVATANSPLDTLPEPVHPAH